MIMFNAAKKMWGDGDGYESDKIFPDLDLPKTGSDLAGTETLNYKYCTKYLDSIYISTQAVCF